MRQSAGMGSSFSDPSRNKHREAFLSYRSQLLLGFGILAAGLVITGPLALILGTPFTEYGSVYTIGLLVTGSAGLVFLSLVRQRRAEEDINRDLQRINRILDACPVGLAVARNRVVEWANQAWKDMYGFQHENEYMGRSAEILYPSQDEFQRIGKVLYGNREGRSITGSDGIFKRRDGTVFNAHLMAKALDPSDPDQGIVAAFFDISDRKRAEEALLES